MTEIIDVNAFGQCVDGETYDNTAAPEVVAAGYMVNVPVVIRYPNGELFHANKVLITPSGIEWLQREMPVEMREAAGSA